MAAKEKEEAGPSNFSDDSIDESLGLTSKSFDPLSIIYGPSLETGHQNVKVFTSVSEFMQDVDIDFETESLSQLSSASQAKECVENKRGSPMQTEEACDDMTQIQSFDRDKCGSVNQGTILTKTVSKIDPKPGEELDPSKSQSESLSESNQMNETKSKPEVSMVKTESSLVYRPRRQPLNAITQMTAGFQEGPLSILRRSVEEKIKVRVWTRSVRNIRGISTGYIIAFDKHMNLAMMDVDEVYRRPLGKHQRKSKKREKNVIPRKDDPVASKETEETPSASKDTEETPTASKETEENPPASKDTEEDPAASKDTEDHPSASMDTEDHPSASMDTEDHPSASMDTEDHPSASMDTEDHPSASMDTDETPSASKDTDETPSASKDTDETPTASKEKQENPTASKETQANPTASNKTEENPSASMDTEENPTASKETEENPTASKETEENPTASKKTEEDPSASNETKEYPSASKDTKENLSASKVTEEILYPNTSWTLIGEKVDNKSRTVGDTAKYCEDADSNDEQQVNVPVDGIGNLTSAFKGMYMFEETEATRLLGAKPRRLLTRHLNQVLLRGDHIVAVALVEPT